MTAPDERAAAREQVAYQVKCAAYNQPLMGVDWTRPENQRWLDVADQIIESALATHARRLEEARAALASSRREREDWGQQIEGHLLYAPPLRCPVCASADEGVRAMVGCPCLPTCAEREENYRAALALARLSPPRREG